SLFLIVTLTQIGLPIAISKRVAEANTANDKRRIKQIVAVSFVIITCTSAFFTLLILVCSPAIASYLLTDQRTLYPLFTMGFAVPFIAFSSVIKGYFQG